MIVCPYCRQTRDQVKAGKLASGNQRYKCKVCHRRYTPLPNESGYPSFIREQAIRECEDGLSFRQVARRFNTHHQTIINWVRRNDGRSRGGNK